jgi:hypothetical protein
VEIKKINARKYSLTFIIIIIIYSFFVISVNLGWISFKEYSIFGAPLLEEAFKGYSAFYLAILPYQSKKFKISLRDSGVLLGLLVGFLFGYAEITQYKTVQTFIILLKFTQHPLWTIAVSVGFCSFFLTRKKFIPIIIYLVAVGAHASWNIYAYYTSSLTLSISVILTLLAILIAFLTYPKINVVAS